MGIDGGLNGLCHVSTAARRFSACCGFLCVTAFSYMCGDFAAAAELTLWLQIPLLSPNGICCDFHICAPG